MVADFLFKPWSHTRPSSRRHRHHLFVHLKEQSDTLRPVHIGATELNMRRTALFQLSSVEFTSL